MRVKLVSWTMPYYEPPDPMSDMTGSRSLNHPEDIITYCARVSNPDNQVNFDTGPKLLKYLMRKSHWSPFEMVDLTFEIETTRDIGRQILRHRSFSFQEFSQRYAVVDLDGPMTYRECRLQDEKNRQNSIPVDDEFKSAWWKQIQYAMMCKVKKYYKEAIEGRIAKEQARALLPEGLTPTVMYMKGSLRSWIHYCLVRMHPGTQKEHRDVAEAVWEILQKHFEFCANINMAYLAVTYQNMFETALNESAYHD